MSLSKPCESQRAVLAALRLLQIALEHEADVIPVTELLARAEVPLPSRASEQEAELANTREFLATLYAEIAAGDAQSVDPQTITLDDCTTKQWEDFRKLLVGMNVDRVWRELRRDLGDSLIDEMGAHPPVGRRFEAIEGLLCGLTNTYAQMCPADGGGVDIEMDVQTNTCKIRVFKYERTSTDCVVLTLALEAKPAGGAE
ncbi:MAG: hypothetical protein ABL985_06540 [Casimicrobium sp.]